MRYDCACSNKSIKILMEVFMAFSLSPSIEVFEKNASFNIMTLPSSLTGMVITSDYGTSFEIKATPTQWDLENNFGTPDKYNFRDWYNAWNFQQYADSLYLVRPIDSSRTTKNAAFALAGGTTSAGPTTYQAFGQGNLYNESIAEQTLPDLVVDSKTIALTGEITGTNASTYSFASFSLMGAESLSQDSTNRDYIKIGDNDVFQISGTYDSYSIDIIGEIPTGWAHTGELTVASGGTGFVLGETITQAGAVPATGVVTAAVATKVTVSDVTGVFEDVTNLVGAGTSVPSASLLRSTSFTTGGTSNVLSGTLDDIKLVFYNKWVTSNLNLGAAVCSSAAAWSLPVSSDISNTFSSYFEFQPEWNNDEFFVIVFKDTGSEWEMLETHMCSYNESARHPVTNRAIYGEFWMRNQSKYVYCKVASTSSTAADVNTTAAALPIFRHVDNTTIYPNDGAVFPDTAYDGAGYAQGDIDAAFDMFDDPDSFDINILVGHEKSMAKASTVAASRKDCMAIIYPYEASEIVGKSATDATTYLAQNFGTVDSAGTSAVWSDWNTYSAVYGNMKYQYDKYNDMNRWMTVGGDVAGLYAETDRLHDPWWAPAGILRGKMKNTIKVAFNPAKVNRDTLYFNAINPIMSVLGEGQGIILGQKTATNTASAFDRVNIRRLLITIEKSIATSLRPFLFEFNEESTRSQIKGIINPYLGRIKARRGLYDFKVVCDETNNTTDIIDANGLIVDVFVQPTKVAEFIQVNVVVTKTGTSFDEIAV